MGRVYRAFDRVEQRIVALKTSDENGQAGPGHPLAEEYEAWSGLDHPNIVRVHQLAVARNGPLPPGAPYLVLEHIRGGPAGRALPERGFPAGVVESAARQLLRALAHVHGTGFLHRDLKPGNVLIDTGSPVRARFKLTDFGLAARVGSATRLGTVSGSLPYVPPEALLGRALDVRADLYGLGVLLYQLSTGELPVSRGGVGAVLRWHLSGAPADPLRVRPEVSPTLARFVRRLTERDPDRRPDSASQALKMLGLSAHGARRGPVRSKDHRGRRAALRLALDAARLGAVRAVRLEGDEAALLCREAAVWAEMRGVDVYRLGDGARSSGAGLTRLVHRMLVERASDPPACVRRFGLDRAIGVGLLGGQPILDNLALRGRPAARGACAETARGIAAFVLHCANRRPLVLSVAPVPAGERLVRELIATLLAAARKAEFAPGRGGLLLLLESGGAGTRPPALARAG